MWAEDGATYTSDLPNLTSGIFLLAGLDISENQNITRRAGRQKMASSSLTSLLPDPGLTKQTTMVRQRIAMLRPAPDVQYGFPKPGDKGIRCFRRQNFCEVVEGSAHHRYKLMRRSMLCPPATYFRSTSALLFFVHHVIARSAQRRKGWQFVTGCVAGLFKVSPRVASQRPRG